MMNCRNHKLSISRAARFFGSIASSLQIARRVGYRLVQNRIAVAILCFATSVIVTDAAETEFSRENVDFFEKQVRPILTRNAGIVTGKRSKNRD